jgi:hypothetical protein
MAVIIVDLKDTFDQWRRKTNELSIGVGDFAAILSAEPSLIRALNENYVHIGDLDALRTSLKGNLVDAINEVDYNTDTNTINIGDLDNLLVDDASSIVNAINENTINIGHLPSLTTDSRDNLVNAINEVDEHTDNNSGAIQQIYDILDSTWDNYISPMINAFGDIDLNNGTINLNNGEETVTDGINENTSLIGNNTANIGYMNLDTPSLNLTDAINDAWNKAQEIGTLSELTTDGKTNLVEAINEIDIHADINQNSIGNLAMLDTGYKVDLVGAINEVNANSILMALVLG